MPNPTRITDLPAGDPTAAYDELKRRMTEEINVVLRDLARPVDRQYCSFTVESPSSGPNGHLALGFAAAPGDAANHRAVEETIEKAFHAHGWERMPGQSTGSYLRKGPYLIRGGYDGSAFTYDMDTTELAQDAALIDADHTLPDLFVRPTSDTATAPPAPGRG